MLRERWPAGRPADLDREYAAALALSETFATVPHLLFVAEEIRKVEVVDIREVERLDVTLV